MNNVYINCLSSFLPNNMVDNEHIEDYLGYIEGKNPVSSQLSLSVMESNTVIMP